MAQQARAIELAHSLDMLDRTVFFVEGWVPYADLGSYLLEADVGVAAHADDLETRFAFRTRLLDCIWAGLPIVTTGGDTLSEVVRDRGLGRVVAPGDVEAYAAALGRTVDADRASFASSMAAVRAEFEWPRVTEPLVALLVAGPAGSQPRSARPTRTVEYAALRGRHVIATRGVHGSLTRAVDGMTKRGRGDRGAAVR